MNFCKFLTISFLMFVIVISFSSCNKEKEVKRIHYNGSYNRDFNDLNDLHLMAAKKIGIKPPSTRDEIEKIKKELREIKSSKTYEVEELKHSIPYLVPKAANLLEMIGKNFRDSLEHLNVPNYKLIVTSLTRTDEDVTKLRRGNLNSSSNSAHTYATTFDISWVRYTKNDKTKTEITSDQLKMVLASVLRDLKKEGKCYVKHERKQGCFHITVK